MPPKKKVEEEKMVLVGRMGTNLKCGIIGLPNVGKSTFFNVLTKTSIAAAENFPFCTIDPNEARVPVPDARFDWLVEHHKPASKVPAFLNVTDIAGLVKGASEGQGLGNAFLSHIKVTHRIYQTNSYHYIVIFSRLAMLSSICVVHSRTLTSLMWRVTWTPSGTSISSTRS